MQGWKFALRSLIRRPGFSLAVFALLTLGIAVNTALFSVVDTVLLKPLPYPEPSQLVVIMEASAAKAQKDSLVAPLRLEDWNRLSRAFSTIAGSYTENVTDSSGSEPQRLSGVRVSPRYFQVFGVKPLVGRTFTADEERFGGPQAAVISYGVWARRYGRDPRITARRLVIGGQGYSVVGVMPPSFQANRVGVLANSIDVWIPAQHPAWMMQQRNARFYTGFGRIKPGFTLEQARIDLAGVQRGLGEQFPRTDKDWSVTVNDLKGRIVGNSGRPLVLLLGSVGLLLLITVTNVAGLVLAQLHQRERELAIRASIGAARSQVVLSVMREMTLLACAGAVGGWALASASLGLLAHEFTNLPRIAELALDWRPLVFAITASFIGAVGFGLLPALRATRADLAAGFLRMGRGIAGNHQTLQRTLVAGQIALTMALLAGAGLLVRSFYNLSQVDLGFHPDNVVMFHVGAAWDENRALVGRMQEQLVAELQRLPSVKSAGITNFLPASGATLRYEATLEGIARGEDQGKMPAGERTVSPGYLKALQAPLLAGQWCPEMPLDFKAKSRAMVNRRFVDVYARGENVVGRQLTLDGFPAEVVGVIGDIKEDSVGGPTYPYVYSCAWAGMWPDPEYVVRASGNPRDVLASIRALVRTVAPNRAVFGERTLEEAIGNDLDRPRSNARLLVLFALSALLLAAVGLYGLVAQMVTAQRREIGIRMAIGAEPWLIVRTIVSGAGWLILAGIVAGFVITLAARPVLGSLLFGVSALDTVSFAGAAVLLGLVSALAAFVPARSAARIDPIETLRAE
jgi:putative ABC transport system permease protein